MPCQAVNQIDIENTMIAVGKTFVGDYSRSPEYMTEIQQLLTQSNTSFLPNKVLGVYYDNPQEKPAEELKSFHGAFLSDENQRFDPSLETLSLQGRWLCVSVSGDPMSSIYEGYNALFEHIQQHQLELKSNAGYQVSTFDEGTITTDIYMALSD